MISELLLLGNTQSPVIIVEDDDVLRQLLSDFFSDHGLINQAFETADDALIYLLELRVSPSLVFTDHLLPGQVSGVEFVNMICKRWPEVPVIVNSGFESDEIMQDCADQVVYLQKPWDLEKLALAVQHALQLT